MAENSQLPPHSPHTLTPMMRLLAIAAFLALAYLLTSQNGLPQVSSAAPKGSFSGYTGAAKTAIGGLNRRQLTSVKPARQRNASKTPF